MRLKEKEGDVFDLKVVNEDVKRLYESGYFDDISVDVKDTPSGKIVTYIVKESPLIGTIQI